MISDVINPTPDLDLFTFDGAQDAVITLTLADLSSGCGGFFNDPCPVAQLFGPDRNLVATLGPGSASKNITLALTGTYTILVFESGHDQNESYTLTLQCLCGACLSSPDISVSPTSFDFGGVKIGFSSAPQTFTISNVDQGALVIGTISTTPSPSAFGILNDTCSEQTLPPGGSCTLNAVFAPTSPGPTMTTLTIPSNDPDTPVFDVDLTGNGDGPATLGGTVTRVNPKQVICQKVKPIKQKVVIQNGAPSWNCEAAGLVVQPGDVVKMTVKGTVP